MSPKPRSLLLVISCVLLALATKAQAAEFCWRESYGRGVGTIPQTCGDGMDKLGLLCYNKCPSGMSRFGFDCHSNCPAGFNDQGLFCRKSEYGRGAGYPWKFGDALNDNGMRGRCEKDHGSGNCEKNGAVYYPKCKPGYSSVGCCICRPAVPNCVQLGLNPGVDLSCAKKIIIGDPKPALCKSDQDKDAGLCYQKCKPTFKGVGPVCWGTPPAGWVECGMGAATTSKVCAETIISQVQSTGSLALNLATLGSSSGLTKSARVAKLKAEFLKIKQLVEKNTKSFEKIKGFYEKYNTLQSAVGTLTESDLTAEDVARASAELASLIDPTGVSDVVASYTYSKCSAIQPKKVSQFNRWRNRRNNY